MIRNIKKKNDLNYLILFLIMVLTEEEIKKRKSERAKIYYKKNEDKIKEQKRIRYINNREDIIKRSSKNQIVYRQTKKGKEKDKKYNNSKNGKKTRKKASWINQGVKLDNFEEIYERYTNAIFCDICECVLNVEGNTNTVKCLDHDHDTGDFRNIVCNYCNIHICK